MEEAMLGGQKHRALETALGIEKLVSEKGLSELEAGSLLLLMASERLAQLPRDTLHEILDECLARL